MYVSFQDWLFLSGGCIWLLYNFLLTTDLYMNLFQDWRMTITWDRSLSMEEEVDVTTVEEWIEGEQLTNHTQLGVKLEQLNNHTQLKAEQLANDQHEVALSHEQQNRSQLASQQVNLGQDQLETTQLTADSQNPSSQPRELQNASDTHIRFMESIQNAVSIKFSAIFYTRENLIHLWKASHGSNSKTLYEKQNLISLTKLKSAN